MMSTKYQPSIDDNNERTTTTSSSIIMIQGTALGRKRHIAKCATSTRNTATICWSKATTELSLFDRNRTIHNCNESSYTRTALVIPPQHQQLTTTTINNKMMIKSSVNTTTTTTSTSNLRPSKIRYFLIHQIVVFVILWIMCCCSSEAFASRSHNSFFGRKVCTIGTLLRGGETTSTTKDRSSSSSATVTTCVMQAPPRITSTTTDNNGEFNNSNNNNNNKDNNNNNNDIMRRKFANLQQIPTNLQQQQQQQRNGASSTTTSTTAFYRPNEQQQKQQQQRRYTKRNPTTQQQQSESSINDVIDSSQLLNDLDSTTGTTNDNVSVQDVVTAAVYVAETKLPTEIGQFQLRAYRIPSTDTNNPAAAATTAAGDDTTSKTQQQQQQMQNEPCVIYSRNKPPFGNATHKAQHVPVRIHDQCLTSEVFGSQRCDCKEQLYLALQYISKHGGCIIYLQQEGRGIGLANKIAAYALQDIGFDTVDANLHLGFPEDNRVYGVVPSILDDMNIGSIQLMTNNPRKVERLERVGVNVERTLPMVVAKTNQYNYRYMETKQNRMNHLNLGNLLSQDPPDATTTTTTTVPRNGLMMPRKSIAAQYINNGTEMSANAVQVSLMVDQDDDDSNVATTTTIDTNENNKQQKEQQQQEGVLAREDGYCFGKQSVLDAIEAVRRGEMVVVVDDMNRENEGDFIMAADQCTALDMAQIVRYSSGVVCIAMKGDRMEELQLPPMCVTNEDPKGTAFSVTVDATKEHGISTGISASDRATTVRLLANPTTTALDFHRPGHIFPLKARDGGVLERDGHTEAAVDLARLAGHNEAGILCEIVSEDNPTEMMRLPELKRFARRHGFVLTSIVDLIQYRRETGL